MWSGMSNTRYLYLPLSGMLGLALLATAANAEPTLREAVRAADAKYLEAPETGVTDDSPKIVAGGGEEGLPPLDEELIVGPLAVTLTYVEDGPQAGGSPNASVSDDALEDIPEEAMLPGETAIGESVQRVAVVTVSVDDPNAENIAQPQDSDATGSEAPVGNTEPPSGPRAVATLTGPSAGLSNPPVSLQIAELDPNNPYPEVVVSFFTGGAHCCSVTSVITSNEDGSDWSIVDVGEFDGGPMLAVDLDGNGAYEFETRDNAFLYAFACYACSQAPLQILALQDGKIMDVSEASRFKPAHAAWLKNMIVSVPDADVNGFLAGYVGQKIRLGEGREAWDLMLKYYERDTDWGLDVCTVEPNEAGECPGETIKLTFPEALERMLEKNGYKIEG